MNNRRNWVIVVWTALIIPTVTAADYPLRPIRYIVPSAPGGSPDITARAVAAELTNELGQQIIIDNRPGASNRIGMELIVKAAPDGYTIGHGFTGPLAFNRSLLADWPFDPDRDMQLVGQMIISSNVLAVTPSLPVKSVRELVDYLRKNPDKLTYGSNGIGTTQTLFTELFKSMTGTRIMQVSYKGSVQAQIDLIGGQIQVIIDPIAAIFAQVKSGKVRGLGVTASKRSPILPDLPTVAEAGVPGYECTIWAGMIAPARVPKEIIARLNAALNKSLTSPALSEKLLATGYEVVGGTPEQFTALVKREAAKWADVIKMAGIKPE